MRHLFIINPIAGGKKNRSEEVIKEIETFMSNVNEAFEIYITRAPLDATAKIRQYGLSEEMLYVYACGGDGTLNECVNGAANRENIAVTQYACGTGNDFIKTFGPENVGKFRDLEALTKGTVKKLDLIDCDGRYGINICSVGIDARVGRDVHKYSRIPIIGGSTGYVVALLINVIKGVTQSFTITVDGKTEERVITLACACNGQYYGGGFNPIPLALADDGIVEYLIIESVSRLKVAAIVGKYAKGQYKEFPDIITHYRGGELKFECKQEFVVNIDGETISTKSICFKAVHKGINFVVPTGLILVDGTTRHL